MFTGLVEEKGALVARRVSGPSAVLEVRTSFGALALGESIAVDGVCLTVTRATERGFEADVSAETLVRTTLGRAPVGAPLNLERSLTLSARIGGHLVSGHVDGVCTLVERRAVGSSTGLTFSLPAPLARFVAETGSVAVSGVSLTVNAVTARTFDVMVIPHTADVTSLGALAVGGEADLEVDLIARYVARLLERPADDTPSHVRERRVVDEPTQRKRDAPMTPHAPPVPPPHAGLTLDPRLLERVNDALGDIRAGRMIILVDDEDRENEGDLCMAAELVTADAINFMATHGRGLICLTLNEEQVSRLGLPMMQSAGRTGPALGTAFTVSIEARSGVTTGISASDRAHTTLLAAKPTTQPDELVTPGHVFPLRSRDGGVLVRTGQTEGSVDLARLAGLTPAGVICEIMNEDGSMARMPDLEVFSKKHGLRILTVADLIQYRLQTERLVRRVSEHEVMLDATKTAWRAVAYEVSTDGRQFLALVKGTVDPKVPMLCRVHAGSSLADIFASTPSEGGKNLREAVAIIEHAGRGVIVYLPSRARAEDELETYAALTTARDEGNGGPPAPRIWPRGPDPRRPGPPEDPHPHEQPA